MRGLKIAGFVLAGFAMNLIHEEAVSYGLLCAFMVLAVIAAMISASERSE